MPRLPAVLRPLYPRLKPVYVHATRLVAPASVALSRLGGTYLPTGVVHSMEEAAATSGGHCVTARPPETIARPPFLGYPQDMPPLEPATDTVVPRLAVAELPNGRILGPHRAVITGRGDLLWELSLYFGTTHPRQHPLFLSPFPGAPHRVQGRLGVLASRGDRNYYHFLIDVLPRLGVLAQAPDIEVPTQWYVPATTRFQLELLNLMGITADQRINSDEIGHVQADCLVVPGLASVVKEKNTPWMVEYLRRRLLPAVPVAAERRPVYITRTAGTNNRAVANEPALIAMLVERGFDVVDPGALSVAEQIRTFAQASVIVSPHGAALANLVFASPGCTVIELFPPGCVLPDYWRLASSVPGLTYRYFSAWPNSSTPQNRPTAIVSDITIDLTALGAMLDELSATP
jgi:capsular polysaccharide biosynthesis protein